MSIISKLFCATSQKGDAAKNAGLATPDDIVRYDHIPYGPDAVWHRLDIYRPRSAAGKLPVLIHAHGGGWVYGDKELYQYYCMSLARQGFAVVNFSYRLAPEHRFPDNLEDMNRVVSFVLEHGDDYGLDRSNLFLAGDSAGANMAMLYTCISRNRVLASQYPFQIPKDFSPRALGLNCGLYDLPTFCQGQGIMAMMVKGLLKDYFGTKRIAEQQMSLISPVLYVDAGFPPCHIVSAKGDFLLQQAYGLDRILAEKGVPHTLQVYGSKEKPLGHVFHCDLRLPEAKQSNDSQMAYLLSNAR